MTRRRADPSARAQRLLRWYPPPWRHRYGDEFGELLAADIAERPRSLHRSTDVALGGIMARCAGAGLCGSAAQSDRPSCRSLATFGCALSAFMVLAVSVWSQLNIARRWSEPTRPATHEAFVIMTIGLFGTLALALVGSAPVAWSVSASLIHRRAAGVRRPAGMFVTGAVLLIAGAVHFRHGWSGSGTHPWTHQTHDPGTAISTMWSSTVAVSAYWAHPTILLRFPVSEVAWMAFSPVALIVMVIGAAQTIRRLDLSDRVLRFAGRTALMASATLGVFLVGDIMWMAGGQAQPDHLFQAGNIDFAGGAVMLVVLGLALRCVQRMADWRSLRL